MKKIAIIIAILIVGICSAKNLKAAYPYHEFGLDFSTISGAGLSYQFKYDVDWTIKFTGLIFYYGDDLPDDGDRYADFGIEIQRNFWKKKQQRAFIFAGGSYWYMEYHWTDQETINERLIINKNVTYNHIWNAGIGAGWEIIFRKRFVVSAELGFLYQTSDDTDGFNLSTAIDYSKDGTSYYGLGGSMGLKIRL